MAIKTFTAGSILTASDTNTYLANSGLVFIKQQELSSTFTNVTSCFNATYDAYRIIYQIYTSSADPEIRINLLSGTTPAAGANYYTGSWLADSAGTLNYSQNGTYTRWNIVYTAAPNTGSGTVDIFDPFNAKNTSFAGNHVNSTGSAARTITMGATHQVASSYDGIQFNASTGSFTGLVTVYGYRKG